MGFLSRRYSTIFKGTTALAVKENWNTRKLLRHINKEDYLIIDKIPKDARDHRVSDYIKDVQSALNDAGIGIHALNNFLFDVQLQQEEFEKRIKAFLRELGKAPVSNDSIKILIGLLEEMKSILNNEDSYDRDKNKDVQAFIVAARGGHETLRNMIMTRFKDETHQSFFQRLAVRGEVAQITAGITNIDLLTIKLRQAKTSGEVVAILKAADKSFKIAFYNLDTLKKRGMLWMAKIFHDLFLIEAMGAQYAQAHLVPMSSAEKEHIMISHLTEEILKDMQDIAQGFRRAISALDDDISYLTRLEDQLMRKAA